MAVAVRCRHRASHWAAMYPALQAAQGCVCNHAGQCCGMLGIPPIGKPGSAQELRFGGMIPPCRIRLLLR